ncbi:transposase family protein [Streptomyces sp. MUM 178J]|uniref:transposase family protein n=1 Tax=Streptomyces sp. MUM 178J TaxID=2791991 RepID=UPI001F0491D7|nr:transposase family protein [Streptomyces sp. MUM 178J]WRQ77917.1 transposase family protein [Streptomyces sp. MUM 178J]
MPTKSTPAGDHTELVYKCRLPLSTQTLTFLTGLLSAHLRKIGSRWRKRPAGRIAVIVLAALRHDQRLADLAGGNDISRTTVDRWLKEMIELLAARAPRLERVLAKNAREGGSVVLLDGSLIPTQRRAGTPMRRRWSAKHKRHGLLVIGLTDLQGRLLWTSTARPARGSEITACRHDDLVGRLREAGLAAIADLGFVGMDDDMGDPAVITGCKKPKGKKLPLAKKLVNQLIAAERAVCEHAFAHLKNWRVLTRLRLDVRWATRLVRALMILNQHEIAH